MFSNWIARIAMVRLQRNFNKKLTSIYKRR